MKKATVYVESKWRHCSQIIAGFIMLSKIGALDLEIVEPVKNEAYSDLAIVKVLYDNKRVVYDVMDGYQSIHDIKKLIDNCDFYFKRSYSEKINKEILDENEINKIHMLGMNYHVTCKGNPYDKILRDSMLKRIILGKKANAYFVPEVFETKPLYKEKDIKILFMTRLWEDAEEINYQRIELISALRECFGKSFIGGLQESKIAKNMAPQLIVNRFATERGRYLKTLKSCDICIGTKGLHNSTGWKTAEYIAAGKAIINEPMYYSVPGNFEEGKNYLSFTSTNECIKHIDWLINNPEELYHMKVNNMNYYYQYLKPDILVKNSLSMVES